MEEGVEGELRERGKRKAYRGEKRGEPTWASECSQSLVFSEK